MSRSVSEGPFDFEITRVDCITLGLGVGGGGGISIMLKVFYAMGKALSGELSCTWTGLVFSKVKHVCDFLLDSQGKFSFPTWSVYT